MHIANLLFKLKTVKRSINPGTDAKVIMLGAVRLLGAMIGYSRHRVILC